jgi:hypothetical protein
MTRRQVMEKLAAHTEELRRIGVASLALPEDRLGNHGRRPSGAIALIAEGSARREPFMS